MRIIAVLVALALYGALCYYLGGLAPKLSAEKSVATQATTAELQEAKQLTTNQKAEDTRDAELASLPTPSTHPVYIMRDQACPVVRIPAEAAATHAGGGGSDSGSRGDRGSDVRPALDAFERKYETALADCREILAKWPISQ